MEDVTIDKGVIEITVLGQKMTFRSAGDPEIVREAVALAMLKIKDAEKRISRGMPHQIAVVALLDLAEDYVRAKKRTLEYRRRMDEKSTALLEMIDESGKTEKS